MPSSASTTTYRLICRLHCIVATALRPNLVLRLQKDIPDGVIAMDPPEYADSDRVQLRLSIPVADFYGTKTRSTWSSIETTLRRVLPTDQVDEVLFDVQYHLVDADHHRLGQVVRRHEAGGHQDLLDHQPLPCGTSIDMLAGDGSWIGGRYEMGGGPEQPALFYVHLWAGSAGAFFPIDDHMIIRRLPETRSKT